MKVRFLLTGLMLAATTVSACQCVDVETFGEVKVPDAGEPPPPPPNYPLIEGDILTYRGLGGRNRSESNNDRVLNATYFIDGTTLDPDTNTWVVNGTASYEMVAANFEFAEMAQLVIGKVGPLESLDEGGAENVDDVDFRADGAFVDTMNSTQFPFFHFEAEYAGEDDSAYARSSKAFRERILELDDQASIENQSAESKFEAYFKDSRGGEENLHKLQIRLHPLGFVCAWDERTVPWLDTMDRTEGSFAQATIEPIAAVFPGNIILERDNNEYRCTCGTISQPPRCKDYTNNKCLTADPEAEPEDC